VPELQLGDAQPVDLRDNPVVSLDTSFDSLRFYIPQIALDEMADESGMRRVKGLYAPNFGVRDPVTYGFAQALAGAMVHPGDGSAMFCDHIALAFFAHIVRVYGGLPIKQFARGGLAQWQLRRAYEYIDRNLAADPSISEVAEYCGLSSSYFGRAFKRESGLSPHQWLMKRRVERAKELLRDPQLRLAEVAQTCGFVDQSHFTRVFSRSEGNSPGHWRRIHRRSYPAAR
jgi:AraC family transcriptional regulator